jgi:hypothetical protein
MSEGAGLHRDESMRTGYAGGAVSRRAFRAQRLEQTSAVLWVLYIKLMSQEIIFVAFCQNW